MSTSVLLDVQPEVELDIDFDSVLECNFPDCDHQAHYRLIFFCGCNDILCSCHYRLLRDAIKHPVMVWDGEFPCPQCHTKIAVRFGISLWDQVVKEVIEL